RRRLDKVLRLLEAEAGDRPHLLDDVDLLVAEPSKDHTELGLGRLRLGSACRSAAASSSSHRDRRRRRDAPLLFQHLRQLAGLPHGRCREFADQLRQFSHFFLLPLTPLGVVPTRLYPHVPRRPAPADPPALAAARPALSPAPE